MKTNKLLLAGAAISLLLAGCQEDEPVVKVDPCTNLVLERAPWLLGNNNDAYALRIDSTGLDDLSECVTWTGPDGAEIALTFRGGAHTFESAQFPPSEEDDRLPYTTNLIDALLPHTVAGTYAWAVSHADGLSEGEVVVPGDEATVILIGDTHLNAKVDGEAITGSLLADAWESKPHLLVHAGDIVYHTYGDHWSDFFKTYGTWMREVPMLPAIGNHEYEFKNEDVEYVLPYIGGDRAAADEGRVQSVDVGNLRIIAFDSNAHGDPHWEDADIGPMMNEVEARLASAGDKMTALVFHHPIYSTSTHSPLKDLREDVLALDDEYDINFVLTGHNHVYERFNIPERFHTILSGGGGAPLYGLSNLDDQDSVDYQEFAEIAYHYVRMDVAKGSITVTAIDLDGNTLETKKLDPK